MSRAAMSPDAPGLFVDVIYNTDKPEARAKSYTLNLYPKLLSYPRTEPVASALETMAKFRLTTRLVVVWRT